MAIAYTNLSKYPVIQCKNNYCRGTKEHCLLHLWTKHFRKKFHNIFHPSKDVYPLSNIPRLSIFGFYIRQLKFTGVGSWFCETLTANLILTSPSGTHTVGINVICEVASFRAFHKLLFGDFLYFEQSFSFLPTFALRAISSFLPILRKRSSLQCLNWPSSLIS